MSGPLENFTVVEIASIGPGPFCAMMLADMGASVIRVDRRDHIGRPPSGTEVMNRGRRSIALDLKRPEAIAILLKLIDTADALVEGFRPGVMERLGAGPDICLARNPKLVFGRMTGWGQEGPLAMAAGHDINYIALSGALSGIGSAESAPIPPLNLVGDFGGGAMLLAFGIVCALLEAGRSGRGQIVDAAMVDGSALLMSMFFGMNATGSWSGRGRNVLGGAAHYYGTYRCADGEWISIGAIEPQFYALLLRTLGLSDIESWPQNDESRWPALKAAFAERFATKTRDEWRALMEGTDICFAPVLGLDEAPKHPHMSARGTFVEIGGVVQPAPAPRFGRSKPDMPQPPVNAGAHTEEVLADLGFNSGEIAEFRTAGAI
jgi:alpha-methylacyl-CoA racemase